MGPYTEDNIRAFLHEQRVSLTLGYWNVGIDHGGANQFFYRFNDEDRATRFYHRFARYPKVLFNAEGKEVLYHDGWGLNFHTVKGIRTAARGQTVRRLCCV